mmetsp:Transcript_67162/g.193111  ORF Transcript_67162/g.193111 Transcript_67162/m.193111 type:complete len:179 (-) Transcript_67162:333-869(-)
MQSKVDGALVARGGVVVALAVVVVAGGAVVVVVGAIAVAASVADVLVLVTVDVDVVVRVNVRFVSGTATEADVVALAAAATVVVVLVRGGPCGGPSVTMAGEATEKVPPPDGGPAPAACDATVQPSRQFVQHHSALSWLQDDWLDRHQVWQLFRRSKASVMLTSPPALSASLLAASAF